MLSSYILLKFIIIILIILTIIIFIILFIELFYNNILKKCESLDNRIYYHENLKSKYYGLKSGYNEKSLINKINSYNKIF